MSDNPFGHWKKELDRRAKKYRQSNEEQRQKDVEKLEKYKRVIEDVDANVTVLLTQFMEAAFSNPSYQLRFSDSMDNSPHRPWYTRVPVWSFGYTLQYPQEHWDPEVEVELRLDVLCNPVKFIARYNDNEFAAEVNRESLTEALDKVALAKIKR